ncbi:IclR family transcriptional regulator domain-containing protein [Branchiibius cervicis]|uniref:IclR family transcriptional regulator C-terminal domain-containing protein n=1 Tax=Branchiibius cervicis TaxID=908252 RepID=A0ABW2AQA5_9MICO
MTVDDADAPAAERDGRVQSLAKGLAVIQAFDAAHPEMTLSDVARRTGLTRATARRFLLTLMDLGYMRSDGRLFRLTPQLLNLGYAYLSSMKLPDIAQPHLQQLSERVGESSSVAVLDGSDIVYVARVALTRIMTVAITVGTRFPAYATSMGQVLLADLAPQELDRLLADVDLVPLTAHTVTDRGELARELAAVREHGYSLNDQQLELGLVSLAAPIRGSDGRVIAAVNVSTRAGTADQLRTEQFLPALLHAADVIGQDARLAGL